MKESETGGKTRHGDAIAAEHGFAPMIGGLADALAQAIEFLREVEKPRR